jgi:hypothetical protein
MSNSAKSAESAKYKIWLIPILAATLLGVIIYNNSGSFATTKKCPLSDGSCPEPGMAAIAQPPVNPAVTPVSAAATVNIVTQALPRFELATVLQNNPFESKLPFDLPIENVVATEPHNPSPNGDSTTAVSAAVEALEGSAASEITERESPTKVTSWPPPALQVSGIFRNGEKVSALVDDRIVFPGDMIADGWRLVAIDNSGLILEPINR